MPTPVKCLLIFQTESGYGWTEQHFINVAQDPPVNLTAVLDLMQTQLAPTRRVLLGQDCSIVGYRASFPFKGAIASLSRDEDLSGQVGALSGSQNDSVAQVMVDGSSTRKKIIHLRGIWGDAVSKEGLQNVNAGGVAYFDALNKYTTALINQKFGWLGKSPTASVFGTVTNYTQNNIDQVTFTIQKGPGSAALNNLIADGAPATFVVRISKLNRSSSNLNRSWVVTPVVTAGNVTGLLTNLPIGTGPFIANGRFNISITNFIQYAIAGPKSLGERRMGKVLSLYPGRARRKPVV